MSSEYTIDPLAVNDATSKHLPENEKDQKGAMDASKISQYLAQRLQSAKERKIGHRRVEVDGEITYKKIYSKQIMGSIQLGIQHAITGVTSKPDRDLLMQDFMVIESTNFPKEGTDQTPEHHFVEFRFKHYAPIAFRYFRDLFGIHPSDYLVSMCSTSLRELSNPGASGSIFYLTGDDEFIIKTIQHKEGNFLQKLLPGYYLNLNQNPRTLLPKFFGLYCYQCNSKNVRLVIMNNILPSYVTLHQKYDLKGSTYKRRASKAERGKTYPIFKDLDFLQQHPEGIMLASETYNALVKTIQRDCRVLESFKIMDYSLLVGIHNLDEEQKRIEKNTSQFTSSWRSEPAIDDYGPEKSNTGQEMKARFIKRLAAHSTAIESIQTDADTINQDVISGGIPGHSADGDRLLIFVGIIDILQSYKFKKKLEHTWKSIFYDGDSVSVHRPAFYAHRFQTFMAQKVFRKAASPQKPVNVRRLAKGDVDIDSDKPILDASFRTINSESIPRTLNVNGFKSGTIFKVDDLPIPAQPPATTYSREESRRPLTSTNDTEALRTFHARLQTYFLLTHLLPTLAVVTGALES